jgi:hypothetical protein
MKIKQIIVSQIPDNYEDWGVFELAIMNAGQSKNIPEFVESIDSTFKLEEEMIFPDDISEDVACDALYGRMIKRLRDMKINPFEDYFMDIGLIEINGQWKNFYEYDGQANMIHFKEKV